MTTPRTASTTDARKRLAENAAATEPINQGGYAEVLSMHVRGDWSDRTYGCLGCSQRFESEAQSRFDALGREPSRDEMVEFRNGYSKVSHPGWSLDEYNAHVAAHLAAAIEARP